MAAASERAGSAFLCESHGCLQAVCPQDGQGGAGTSTTDGQCSAAQSQPHTCVMLALWLSGTSAWHSVRSAAALMSVLGEGRRQARPVRPGFTSRSGLPLHTTDTHTGDTHACMSVSNFTRRCSV